jgi:hypothetical protein
VPTFIFREQTWNWDEGLSEIIKPGEKVTIEIHAQVNSVMIGMLVAANLECKVKGASMEVVVFNRGSEKSLSIPGIKDVISCRKATSQERQEKCERVCPNPCHQAK